MYTSAQKHFLLSLARRSIEHYLETSEQLVVNEEAVEPELREKRGVFVTLTLDGQLRGCIGHLEAVQPLYKDVMDNAVSAAFHDPRFSPVSAFELHEIHIEISVLSEPEKVFYRGADDLLSQLSPGIDGLILGKGRNSATYLPQVWDQLPDKRVFLSSLCHKAGLPSSEWEKGDLDVSRYRVESFEEE